MPPPSVSSATPSPAQPPTNDGLPYFWPKPEGWLRLALEFTLVALLYFGLFKLGLLAPSTRGQPPPFWPPAGFAVAVLFLGGRRQFLSLATGMLAAYLSVGSSPGSSFLQGFGNLMEAALGAMLLRQTLRLHSQNIPLGETLGCVAASLFAPLPAAFLGATGRWIQTGMPNLSGLHLLGLWWLGDTMGILVLLPPLLLLARKAKSLRPPRLHEYPRILSLAAVLGLLTWLIFFQGYGEGYLFALGPLLMIATTWFGATGARCTASLMAWISLLLATQDLSLLGNNSPLITSFLLQIFLAGLCLTALLLPLIHFKGDLRLPALVLLTGWGLSAWLFATVQADCATHNEREEEHLTQILCDRLSERLGSFETLLRGGAALHSAHGSLNQQLWHDYVQSLGPDAHFHELSALALVLPVHRQDLEAFLTLRRAEDSSDFRVRPVLGFQPGESEELHLTTYIEPNRPNSPALGVDNATDPGRRSSAIEARDKDQACLSRHTSLVVDGGRHAGFLLFLPLYHPGSAPRDLPSRRTHHQGWLAASFLAESLIENALGAAKDRFLVRLYEGDATTPDNLVYSNAGTKGPTKEARFSQSFSLYGRNFHIECAPLASPLLNGDGSLLATTGCLFIITILLSGLILSIQTTGERSRTMAAALTEELKDAQGVLQESLRFQEAVINATSFCIIATDAQGRIEVFNSGAEKMLGYRRHELVGKSTPLPLHDPAELQQRARELTGLLGREVSAGIDCMTALPRLGRTDQHEWTFRHKDGSHIPVLLCVNARLDAHDRIVGYVGIAYDLSAQRRAEDDLRKAHARLKSIFDTTSEGLMLIDQRGRIAEWNSAAATLLGVRDQALMRGLELAEAPWNLLGEEGLPISRLSNPALTCLRNAQPQTGINLAIQRPGEPLLWVCMNCQPLLDEHGEVRGVVCSLVDISLRREHERRLRASLEEVANLRDALNEHSIVYITDSHGQLSYVNDKGCQSCGYTREELLGRDPRILNSGVHPKEFFQELWMTILRGRVWRGEICNRAKNGTQFWVQTTIRPIAGADGKPVQFIAIAQDLSPVKQLEHELAVTRNTVAEASRHKSEFLTAMSHEIRTPMNGIIGMAGLLMSTPLDPHQRNMGRVIRECSETLLTTIDDLLDFSLLEAGRLTLEKGGLSLRQVIDDTVARLGQEAHDKRLELTCDSDPELGLRVCGDEHRIRQLVTNLVRHSILNTPSGEVNVRALRVETHSRSLRLRLLVGDTGPGLSEGDLAMLFTPFRSDAGNTRPASSGQGLGLAISRRLALLMGGDLQVESPEGGGLRFTLSLELERALDDEPAPPGPLPPAELLVVDDNDTNRGILAGQLHRMGLDCLQARDAQEALGLLKQQALAGKPVGIALLDWHMPGMNGLDLAAAIRADPLIRGIRLVMLSSSAPYIDPDSIASIRFDAFLSKPVRELQLHELLRRILSNDASPAEPAGSPASGRNARRGLRILLAEDNDSNQAVARLLLTKMGHQVEVTDTGEQVLDRLANGNFDLLLTDCDMPGLDGYECARRIREGKIPGVPNTLPVIALTAYARPEDRQRCLEAGMNDHVPKPLSLQTLQDAFFRCGLLGSMLSPPLEEKPHRPATDGSAHAIPPTAGPSLEPLDAKVLAEMRTLPGNYGRSLLPELVDTFLREEKGLLGELLLLCEQRKGTQLGATAHRIAGSCSYLGAKEIRALTLAVEAHALKGEWPEAEAKLEQLKSRWPGLREALRHTLD